MLRMVSSGGTDPLSGALFFWCFVGEVRLANLSMPERKFLKNPGPGVTPSSRHDEVSRMIRQNPKHPYNPPS